MSKFCSKCGAEAPDDARFCLKCGTAFSENNVEVKEEAAIVEEEKTDKEKIPQELKEEKPKKKGCLVAVLIVVVIVGILIALVAGGSSSSNDTALIDEAKSLVLDAIDANTTIGTVLESSMTDTKWESNRDEENGISFVYFTGIDSENKKWKITFQTKDSEDFWDISHVYYDGQNYSPYSDEEEVTALILKIYGVDVPMSVASNGISAYVECTYMDIPVYSGEKEDTYKNSCEKISGKDLLRNPDQYIGKRIKVDSEIIWKSAPDGYPEYFDAFAEDALVDIVDCRLDKSIKLLANDDFVAYGEFVGLAVSTVDNEIPVIAARYIDIK